MKLGSIRHGRDGRLVVVSRDLTQAAPVPDIAPTLQAALDDWDAVFPLLNAIYHSLNVGGAREAFSLDPSMLASPLPRAYQWADGSAYVNHVELVRRARGVPLPASFWTDPLLYQGGSDGFLDPAGNIPAVSEDHGIDFEGELAIVTGDVPMGTGAADALGHIRLLMLVNDVSLRGVIPDELAKGFGFYQGKPATAFGPVAVTPDELGGAWRDGRVHLPLRSELNGDLFGCPEAGQDMTFSFPELIAHAARTRSLAAGSIIGSGTVSNRDEGGGAGRPVSEGGRGYSCIAELRMIETIRDGKPATPFMRFGDRVRLEMIGTDGQSVFGAIDQTAVRAGVPSPTA